MHVTERHRDDKVTSPRVEDLAERGCRDVWRMRRLSACEALRASLPAWRSWKRRRFVIVRSWVRVPPPAPRMFALSPERDSCHDGAPARSRLPALR